jgi:hypothetical protein
LEAIVADVERCQRGSSPGSAQDAMTRFTALPALFLGSFGKTSLFGQRSAGDAGVNRQYRMRPCSNSSEHGNLS